MDRVTYEPIGIIHSSFKNARGTPIQAAGAAGTEGTVEVFPKFAKGLEDIDGFSHIILIYHFHLSKKSALIFKPFLHHKTHGVFACRAPSRPNQIGISTVRLVNIKKNILYIQDVDIVDGTPLLDIKPYVPQFDLRKVGKIGWLEKEVNKVSFSRDDGRFTK
jgi:tRNA-Thr(GGU) m(6)t(6)A37 methyltransferase TsaA